MLRRAGAAAVAVSPECRMRGRRGGYHGRERRRFDRLHLHPGRAVPRVAQCRPDRAGSGRVFRWALRSGRKRRLAALHGHSSMHPSGAGHGRSRSSDDPPAAAWKRGMRCYDLRKPQKVTPDPEIIRFGNAVSAKPSPLKSSLPAQRYAEPDRPAPSAVIFS